jgi:hypothetical protein
MNKVVYQPVYFNQQGELEAVSEVVFPTAKSAEKYGRFVCAKGLTVKVLTVRVQEVIK